MVHKKRDEDESSDDSSNEDTQSHSSDESNSNVYFEIVSQPNNSNQPSPETIEKWALVLRFLGMIGMTFLNPLFCVLAMNYASPSILAPFSGLTLVWIVLFSETMIGGEKPQWKQIVAAALIILGEVIVAIFGDHTNDEGMGLEDVLESYEKVYFQAYFVFMILYDISTKKCHFTEVCMVRSTILNV